MFLNIYEFYCLGIHNLEQFPPTAIIHGGKDRSVPIELVSLYVSPLLLIFFMYRVAEEFSDILREAHVKVKSYYYPQWTHTDPILGDYILAIYDGNC
jgi:acetyl esterase/lipase